MVPFTPTRQARRASCALILVCAFMPAARGQESKADADSAQKPAAKSTTTHPQKKTTSQTSSSPSSATKSTARTHNASTGKRSSRKKTSRVRGQQKIDSQRAESIQTALIREHYLSGEPSGKWDQQSEEAMRRYQADHGWQTKEVPDSRALIRLGLGPSKDGLLNPDSAMTTSPASPKAPPIPAASHSASSTADLPPTPSNSPNR